MLRCAFGRGPALAAAILSVLVFDYFFVSPSFSFAIQDAQYAITLSVMLGIGLLISALTSKLQSQLRDSETKERRTAALYQITRRLSEASGLDALLETAETQFQEIFGGQMVLYLCNSDGVLQLRQGENTAVGCDPSSIRLAELAMRENRNVQAVADEHALAGSLFVPMLGLNRKVGVLGVKPVSVARFDDPEEAAPAGNLRGRGGIVSGARSLHQRGAPIATAIATVEIGGGGGTIA